MGAQWHDAPVRGLLIALLASTAVAQNQKFSGLDNAPLGAATLSIDTGELRVANIGSSGLDGVRVQHSGFDGVDLEWYVEQMSPGARLDTKTRGWSSGQPDQLLSHTWAQESGSRIDLFAAFPTAPTTKKRVELHYYGEIVAAADDISTDLIGSVVQSAGGANFSFYSDYHVGELPSTNPLCPGKCAIVAKMSWLRLWGPGPIGTLIEPGWDPGNIQLVTKVVIKSDCVECEFDHPVLDHTDILLKDAGDLMVQAEGVQLLGHNELGLGGVSLDVGQAGELVVSDLGPSGNDGVAVHVGGAGAAHLELAGLPDPAGLSPGDRLEMNSKGTMGGQPGADLGIVRVARVPGASPRPLRVVSDYSQTGASGVLLELLNDGDPVEAVSVPDGILLRIPEWPERWGKRVVWWPRPVPCYWIAWDDPIEVVIPQLGPYIVDEVRILAENPGAGVTQIDAFYLRATDLGGFQMTAVSSEPPDLPQGYCTAKSNLLCGAPDLTFSGSPSASASSGFEITAAPARGNRTGMLLYSDAGRIALPFQGGFLCVSPPLKRTPTLFSGGTNGTCDGAFAIDMNAFASGGLGGNPASFLLVPGTQVNAQCWGRDSVATGSFLSAGLEWTVGP